MKKTLLTSLISIFVNCISAQTVFSFVESKVATTQADNSTNITCGNDKFSVRFKLKQKVVQQLEGNFVYLDSQLVQITPLVISNYKKSLTGLTESDQKELLEEYSTYELEYFKNELKFEIINPTTHLVTASSKIWLVWYFKVGNLPSDASTKMDTQLFASTIIGDKILTLNAPMHSASNFAKGALLVNEMMESLTLDTKE